MFILPQFYYSVTQRQFPHEINSVNAILIFHDPCVAGYFCYRGGRPVFNALHKCIYFSVLSLSIKHMYSILAVTLDASRRNVCVSLGNYHYVRLAVTGG